MQGNRRIYFRVDKRRRTQREPDRNYVGGKLKGFAQPVSAGYANRWADVLPAKYLKENSMSKGTIIFNLVSRLVMGAFTLWLALTYGHWLFWALFATNAILVVGWVGSAGVSNLIIRFRDIH